MAHAARLNAHLKFVFGIVILLTTIELVNLFTGRGLNIFGNYPRELFGLKGILFSHFLHGNFTHFLSNIITLAIFSFLMLQYGTRRYIKISLFLIVITGVLVWMLARPAMHIGASGIVYGYLGFLILGGLISGRLKLLAIALLVAFFYGGLMFGMLPSRAFVSWESHLFGFVAGLIAAKIWAKAN